MAAVAAQVSEHEKKLNKVMPAVFGVEDCPGTGLVDRTEKLEDAVGAIKDWVIEQKNTNKWLVFILTILVTAIVGAIIKILFGS